MILDKNTKSKSTPSERNLIGVTTSIKGNIFSKGDFRIDGKIEGEVKTTGKIIIAKSGVITGTVNCSNADIEGKVTGKLTCSEALYLKSTAVIDGDVFVEKLIVEPGATFNVTCDMNGAKTANRNKVKKVHTAS